MKRSKVASEITGKVWKIAVEVGAQVAEDEPIVILESMKMEIPVSAPVDCVIVEILVAEGDTVSEGQAVVVIEG